MKSFTIAECGVACIIACVMVGILTLMGAMLYAIGWVIYYFVTSPTVQAWLGY
jgi:hypothetical protein